MATTFSTGSIVNVTTLLAGPEVLRDLRHAIGRTRRAEVREAQGVAERVRDLGHVAGHTEQAVGRRHVPERVDQTIRQLERVRGPVVPREPARHPALRERRGLIQRVSAAVGELDLRLAAHERGWIDDAAEVQPPAEPHPRALLRGQVALLETRMNLAVVDPLHHEVEARVPRQYEIRRDEHEVARHRIDVFVRQHGVRVASRRKPGADQGDCAQEGNDHTLSAATSTNRGSIPRPVDRVIAVNLVDQRPVLGCRRAVNPIAHVAPVCTNSE